jgi:diguanylate cyclase (GGDEF)-like protein
MANETTRLELNWRAGAPTAPAKPCLVVILGPDLGHRIPLEEPALIIGRELGNDVLVPLDGISREHCEIGLRDGAAFIRDLGSTNGTWLNGRQLPARQEVPLFSGDRIELAGAVFKFLEGGDVESKYHEEIYQLTIADGLTRAFNRRYLMDFLAREISRCRRHERPLALLLVDVDHYKHINDRFGHAAGDHVLRELAGLMGELVRREECLARHGGDEFALVLPETPAEGARIVAERIRERIEQHPFVWNGEALSVTASLGVAGLEPEISDPESLLAAADAKLYAAKARGRNAAQG